jgi:hypothetical protein
LLLPEEQEVSRSRACRDSGFQVHAISGKESLSGLMVLFAPLIQFAVLAAFLLAAFRSVVIGVLWWRP